MMSTYTIGAIAYMIAIGFLVTVLLGGAFLVLNLGLMSKRDEDRTGHRDPSDVGLLKNTNWPQEPESEATLPAMDDDEAEAEAAAGEQQVQPPTPIPGPDRKVA